MTAVRLLYASADQQGTNTTLHPRRPRRRRRRVNWPLPEAKSWLTLPHPGGHGGEAALVMDRSRHCDRNRGGREQDEFYHGEISIFDPSVLAIFMPNSGIRLHVPEQTDQPEKGSRPLSFQAKLAPN
jgi:hypothetical protein